MPKDLIQNIMMNNFIGANDSFDEVMNDKVSNALADLEVGLTNAMFNEDDCDECDAEEVDEELADKDYDGDGKIETGSKEYIGSRDRAIKAAIAKRKKKG